jgi:hypothetical protein
LLGYRFRGIWGALIEAVAFVYRDLDFFRHLFQIDGVNIYYRISGAKIIQAALGKHEAK